MLYKSVAFFAVNYGCKIPCCKPTLLHLQCTIAVTASKHVLRLRMYENRPANIHLKIMLLFFLELYFP